MLISGMKEVLLTIAYADQFNFPLTAVEIHLRLIEYSLTKKSLKKILLKLEKKFLIESQGQYWRLCDGKANNSIRIKREKNSHQKWDEVDILVKTIGWIPWIRGVAVTGSLAVNNALANSDIDLMVVVEPQRLWLCRVLVSLSTSWVGKRRTWQGNEDNSWCFNLWIDDEHLLLPPKKRNIYSSHEVCQAKWVLDKVGIEKKFYQENYWAKDFIPNYFINNYKSIKNILKKSTGEYKPAPILRFVGRKVLSLLNFLIFIPQYGYMYPHMSREKVSLNSAYFHPRSTKNQIYDGWLDSIVSLRKQNSKIVLVTGVFDLFHREHANFLKKAKDEGDVLVVGVESDDRVRKSKGTGRPINSERKRLHHVKLFSEADLAFVLPKEFDGTEKHLAMLRLIRPHVLAVSTHTPHLKEKRRLMKKIGGEVKIVYQQQKNISTTQILTGK